MTEASSSPAHACNGWCKPPLHCTLIFANTRDVDALLRQLRQAVQVMDRAVQIVQLEIAHDAPPRAYFAETLQGAAADALPPHAEAVAYRVWFYGSGLFGADAAP